ncbi:TetR/AcrR family transcriptional regulator [Streptomyces sp. MS19]|uniref:TetR/AcrR family transcriptional regulator n=1 Tax=Streptomyces sp. MS19 TaxID=3385972 RepID=UPI0039A0F0A0
MRTPSGASVREIAKRAGVSHAGLLHYFPGREALLAAVLGRRDERDAARFGPGDASPTALVERFLDLAGHNARNPGIIELYVRLSAEAFAPDHPAHGYFTRHYADVRRFAHSALLGLERQGLLRRGIDAWAAAVSVVALMDGLQVQWLTSPAEVDMVGSLRFFAGQLMVAPTE